MDASPLPFAALMALGFLVGIAGHLYKSPATVAVGIFLVFLATILLPLASHLGLGTAISASAWPPARTS